MKKGLILLVFIFLLISCSEDFEGEKLTVSELLPGKWELMGTKYVGCDEFDKNEFIEDFEYDEIPTESTIIEIEFEEIEFEHWELGTVRSEISISVLSGSTYGESIYKWVEFEYIFENFDTQDLHAKEYIVLLTQDRLVWATGCGFPSGIKRDFRRVIE